MNLDGYLHDIAGSRAMTGKSQKTFPARMQPTTETNKVQKVVIIDDHELIVMLLTQIFATMSGYAIVGHAKNSVDALKLCEQENPDFVMLDLVLSDGSGLGLR